MHGKPNTNYPKHTETKVTMQQQPTNKTSNNTKQQTNKTNNQQNHQHKLQHQQSNQQIRPNQPTHPTKQQTDTPASNNN